MYSGGDTGSAAEDWRSDCTVCVSLTRDWMTPCCRSFAPLVRAARTESLTGGMVPWGRVAATGERRRVILMQYRRRGPAV
eukprot:1787973-Prymnesium_polylepis.1